MEYKWSLYQFTQHMIGLGHDMKKIWADTYDVILKSLISAEEPIVRHMRGHVKYKTNCFEIYGYDIMLDEDLKPWLVEINLSPSVAIETPFDFKLKNTLIHTLLNMV